MNPLRGIYDWLDSHFSKDEVEEIRELKAKNEELAKKVSQLQVAVGVLSSNSDELEAQVKSLTDAPVAAPSWLNQKERPYMPIVIIASDYYLPLSHSQDIIARTYQIKKVVDEQGWRKLKTDEEKLDAVWEYVKTNVYYRLEKRENFQFPVVTLVRREGDCDDSTDLFIALARESGVPADKVFAALGYVKDGPIEIGHDYPIALYKGRWCVFECTMGRNNPDVPLYFKGSNYRSPNKGAIRGVYNDVFAGVIKGAEQLY